MTVGFRVGSIVDEVGTDDFLHAFFSTISYHLEPKGWGSVYPEFMKKLYKGGLPAKDARKVHSDVLTIRERLKEHPPSAVVWDIEDPTAKPPWGNDISPTITNLANYFWTSTGRDLFDVLLECLDALQQEGGALTIERY